MDMISNDLNEFLDGLEKLLKEGDPAALDSVIAIQGTTPEFRNAVLVDALVLSCAGRYLNMVKHLLTEYGLDPNATSQTIDELRGQPPLILAAKCVDWLPMQLESNIDSQVETIVQLFRHGARLSCPSRLGKTALSYVTHVRVADALLACEDAEDLRKLLLKRIMRMEEMLYCKLLGRMATTLSTRNMHCNSSNGVRTFTQ